MIAVLSTPSGQVSEMDITLWEDKPTKDICQVCGRNFVVGVIISTHPKEGKMVKGQIIQTCPNYEACGFMAALKK